MRWHLIEGEDGCRYAVEHHCVAVIVDALRASATATMILDQGANTILAVREIEDALHAKADMPDALLFGERGGLPPEGFDYGNSPRDAAVAKGRNVIFTTTTGAGRLVSCWMALAIYMGTPLNARAVARLAQSHGKDVVVIPAGLASDPEFDAQEDWAGAAAVVMAARGASMGEGASRYELWRKQIMQHGLPKLFAQSPHAEKLRRIGLDDDISYCAQLNTTHCVPAVVDRNSWGVLLQRAKPYYG